MKYTVQIGDKSFQVEIKDLNSRPIVAVVDGETYEVTPETAAPAASPEKKAAAPLPSAPLPGGQGPAPSNSLVAPLPGTVIEVFVKPGDAVETGQVILVIEAMKMKNSIRSTRSGFVSEVLVSAGATVAHKQVLVTFTQAGEASWI